MKVSVVMTTYNGARFLPEMLDSLLNQTREIDELLIFDDKSKDNTVQIINNYISKYDLTKWRLVVNDKNLGWEKNFLQGLEKATGDVIYPCDQDDIWHTDKIEKMTKAFEENDNIWLLVSGFHAFSEYGGEMTVQNAVKTETQEIVSKVKFDEHYYVILRPGCTMGFRKNLLPLFVKNWRSGTPHDAVLWTVAVLLDKLYLYDETLIEFRRHDSNASRSISHGYIYKVNEPYRTQIVNQWYVNSEFYDSSKQSIIDGCNQWCILRKKLLVEGNPLAWFQLVKYRKYYLTTRKYVGDVYYFIQQFKKENAEAKKGVDKI